jgi:glutamate-ammonia-ligase adenylyltransferase
VWDIKTKRGGMIEVEFVAQTLQILSQPLVWSTNTGKAIDMLSAAGHLSPNDARSLGNIWTLYTNLTQAIRLCLSDDYAPEKASPSLNQALSRAAALPDISAATAALAESAVEVIEIFDEKIGSPDS